MSKLVQVLVVVTALAATPVSAAMGAGRSNGLRMDQLARRVFPVELVLANQRQIGLTDEQRGRLVAEMQQAQGEILPLQVEISASGEELARLLEETRPDEERVLALTGDVLALEAQIKKRHMTLLVRVKNLLTAEQQRQLQEIRRRRMVSRP